MIPLVAKSMVGGNCMNVVGIDVSKGKSTVCFSIRGREFEPYDIWHNETEFRALEEKIKALDGETKVVLESTGRYHIPLSDHLHEAGIDVSVINAKVLSHFDNNSVRKAKTDRLDSIKISRYGKTYWGDLKQYEPEDQTRRTLKMLSRQYVGLLKIQTELTNQLISMTDVYFPGINTLLDSPKGDGSVKWVEFIMHFHSASDVKAMRTKAFTVRYESFCKKNGYYFSEAKAAAIHLNAEEVGGGRKTNGAEKLMLETIASQLQSINRTVASISKQMDDIASTLPEYEIVMDMFGVGKKLGPQLMAEIGDVTRFHSKKALVAFAGIDPPPNSSGQKDPKSRRISKCGPGQLRKTLFLVMETYIISQATEQPLFQFIERKMMEGKHYYVCLIAASNKFLRQYYARVTAHMAKLEQENC